MKSQPQRAPTPTSASTSPSPASASPAPRLGPLSPSETLKALTWWRLKMVANRNARERIKSTSERTRHERPLPPATRRPPRET